MLLSGAPASPLCVIAVGPLILHLLIHIHLSQCQNTTSRGQRGTAEVSDMELHICQTSIARVDFFFL